MHFTLAIAIGILTDLSAKFIARLYLRDEIALIGDNFTLKLIYNPGIAFSLPITGILLKIITVVIIAAIFHHYLKHEKPKRDKGIDIAYGLIIGGALGNAVERLLFGEVTDFLKIKYFAIFNFGDIFINIGVLMLLYLYLKQKGMKKI